jgi:hypothetical protein
MPRADVNANLQAAKFVIDDVDLGVFEGFHDPGERWNGFACPYFTSEVVDEIAQTLAAGLWGSEAGALTREGSDVVYVDPSYDDERQAIPMVVIDGRELWAVGSWGWVWSAWSDEDIADRLEELSAERAIGSGR